jgi:serine protease Do
VVTHFAGKEVSEMRFLPRMVAETKIGSTVDITYFRKGKSLTSTIKIGELDEDANDEGAHPDRTNKEQSDNSTRFLGMQLATLSKELRAQLRLVDGAQGLVVMGLSNDSPALRRGLRRGDVLTEANGEATTTITALRKIFSAAKKSGRKFVMVQVIRNGEAAFVTLPVE